MKLKSARIQNYRSIKDTGVIEFERDKTILVGPNEAGKSAILQALQQLKPPKGVRSLDALRDYPRSLYNDITKGKVDPATTPVVTAVFTLEDEDRDALPESLQDKITEYRLTRNLDNRAVHTTDLEKTGTSSCRDSERSGQDRRSRGLESFETGGSGNHKDCR